MKPTIMLVDDRLENLKMLEKILCERYRLLKYDSGRLALEDLTSARVRPDLILLDIIMPDMDGYQVLRALKAHRQLEGIPVICITAGNTEQQALASGAADYISKPFDPYAVKLRIHNQILLKRHMDDLEGLVREKTEEVVATRDNMLLVLADIIEYRSIESGSHVKRVAKYAQVVLENLLKDSPYAGEIEKIGADVIVKSVPMHDIGKIGIADSILLKPGKLEPREFEMMKTHTVIGRAIINSILCTGKEHSDFLKHCSDIAYYHHEKYDGTGYPEGIKGDEIPLSARIMAIVDVYDALATKRIYKKALEHWETVAIIREGCGKHFDPVVAEAFLQGHEKCRTIADQTFGHLA